MRKSIKSFTYVFLLSLVLFFLATFIIYFDEEHFAQCVYRPKGKRINSLNIDINISKKMSAYELTLSAFQKLLELNKIDTRKNIITNINNLSQIKSKFKIIYEIDNEMLIYRSPSAYGFHLKFMNNPKYIKVLGVVNHYDIISQYMDDDIIHQKNILKTYKKQ